MPKEQKYIEEENRLSKQVKSKETLILSESLNIECAHPNIWYPAAESKEWHFHCLFTEEYDRSGKTEKKYTGLLCLVCKLQLNFHEIGE